MSTLIQIDTVHVDGHDIPIEAALTAVFDDGHVAAEAEARQEAEQLEREEAEAIFLRRKAGQILRGRGHAKAGQVLLDNTAVGEEDRPHLEEAARDFRIPFPIKARQLFPRLNALDIARLANGAFGLFVAQIVLAAQKLFAHTEPTRDDVEVAREALLQANDIAFDGPTMGTIERIFVHAELPGLSDLVRQYREFGFAVALAEEATPRKKASVLLRGLKDRLWSRINEIRDAQPQSERQRDLTKTKGNPPTRKGKTARERQNRPNRDAERRQRQLKRAAQSNTPPAAGGKKKKK